MRIALAQMKNQGSVEANLNQSIEWMREAAEHGADLILFPEVQLTEFFPQYGGQDVRRYRLGLESPEVQAFHNSAAIAMCNRVGCEGEMAFSGESIVVDANGQVLARAGDAEELLYADVDMAASRRIRESRPYTGLRRPEFYV